MYIKTTRRQNGSVSLSIVQSVRVAPEDGGSVKVPRQRYIKAIGTARGKRAIASLVRRAKKELARLSGDSVVMPKKRAIPKRISASELGYTGNLVVGGYDIFGKIYNELGFNAIIKGSSDDRKYNEILKGLIILRIDHPECSKIEGARILSEEYGINFPTHDIYLAMDELSKCSDRAMSLVFEESMRLHGGKIEHLLFDVTTTYFESSAKDDLRQPGYSKDNKSAESQIVKSLITTDKGFPISHKVFPGNTAECKTLIDHLSEVIDSYPALKGASLAADRGLSNNKNFCRLEDKDIDLKYVIACKLRSLSRNQQERILDDKDEALKKYGEDKEWARSYPCADKGRRLVVGYCPKRAERDRKLRDEALEKMFKKSKDGTRVRISKVVRNKYLKGKNKELEIDKNKISEEARFDGVYGMVTNSSPCNAKEVFRRYQSLYLIEEAFRILKTDLKLRPIRHWTGKRIEAHVLICYLALAISKFAQAKINAKTGKQLSVAKCKNIIMKVKSAIMTGSADNYLYIFPVILNEEQQLIYDAVEVVYRKDNVRILSPPAGQLQSL